MCGISKYPRIQHQITFASPMRVGTYTADGSIEPVRGLDTRSRSVVTVVEAGILVEVGLQVADGQS